MSIINSNKSCIIDDRPTTKSITLTFHSDSGHWWLAVPVDTLRELHVDQDISIYSYMQAGYAYLEEDCDLSTFMIAAKHHGYHVNFVDSHVDGDSFVRSLPRYINHPDDCTGGF